MRRWWWIFTVLLVSSAYAEDSIQFSPIDKTQSKIIFERFKKMAGHWEGQSTAGWEGTTETRVIARGSVVMNISRFNDEPEEGMATMLFMDGDRLLLTHYCEAGNQPTLVASGIDQAGNSVEFLFLNATNLPSRDKGHMDHVIYTFQDDTHFTSRWTWYSKGKETWLEEITYQKTK
jgi:hypothetical protein